jgi:putative ABC transport system permease protein
VKMAASDNPRISRSTLLEGTQEELWRGFENGELVVSENFARKFGVHRGDAIALGTRHGSRKFKIAAVVIDYTSDRGLIRLHRDTHIEHWGDRRVDSYELFLKRGVEPERVRALINDRLARKHDLFVLTTREFRGEFVKAANRLFDVMHVLELVTLVVALLGMVSAVLANVLDRVRELGVLRAVGMLRAQLRKMVTIEATLIGLVGAIGGVFVGIGIGYILLRHVLGMQIGWHLPYEFPLPSIVTMLLVTLPLSAFSGFYPALRAGRLAVREALDYE